MKYPPLTYGSAPVAAKFSPSLILEAQMFAGDAGFASSGLEFLIRPPRSEFVFTYLHGITWDMVRNAPTFAQLWPQLNHWLCGVRFLAAHNATFDRGVLEACCRTSGLAPPDIPFECTVRMARDVFGIYPTRLDCVCDALGISLIHHQAESDAEARARIVLAARSKAKSIPS